MLPPPPAGKPRKDLYARLLTQLESLGVPVLDADALPPSLTPSYDAAVDALFGFSFRGAPRPPYDALIDRLRPAARPPPVVCVDVPSGWDVDTGADAAGADPVQPAVLVSLTAPKPAAARLAPGVKHYVGGRFVPPTLAAKYGLALPAYPGAAQIVRVDGGGREGGPSTDVLASVADVRADYGSPPPEEASLVGSGDPMQDFAAVFADAAARGGCDEPNAMCLATTDADGAPSARYVLLKGFDAPSATFTFYTNANSRKGGDLARPGARAALVFYYERLRRSVRVEGRVARVPDAEADAYFASRPRGSQVGAHASPQSAVLAGGRAELEAAAAAAAARYADASVPVPRPAHWGGYAVAADRVEFWQGRASRLHDRLVYEKQGDGTWASAVLAP